MDLQLRLCRGGCSTRWLGASRQQSSKSPAGKLSHSTKQNQTHRASRTPSQRDRLRAYSRAALQTRGATAPGSAPLLRDIPGAREDGDAAEGAATPGHKQNRTDPKNGMGWDTKPSPRQAARTTGQPVATMGPSVQGP